MQLEQSVLIRPEDGELVWFGGVGAQFKLFGEQTRGAFSLIVQPVEPGRLAPPHVHWGEDEFSYVLEGELGARVGDHEVVAGPGSIILKPKGVPHAFWNATSKPAKFIEIISPPGLEAFFVEFSDIFRTGEFSRLDALGKKYDMELVEGWTEELTAKYDLKLLGQ
ncbi:MAG: cupin domain-containing protein [Candidatus Dormibacteraeota bacterium]|nr:cupin domain-containing protein [Candidatus Dormibacteraeota bacterium]